MLKKILIALLVLWILSAISTVGRAHSHHEDTAYKSQVEADRYWYHRDLRYCTGHGVSVRWLHPPAPSGAVRGSCPDVPRDIPSVTDEVELGTQMHTYPPELICKVVIHEYGHLNGLKHSDGDTILVMNQGTHPNIIPPRCYNLPEYLRLRHCLDNDPTAVDLLIRRQERIDAGDYERARWLYSRAQNICKSKTVKEFL